VAAPPWTKAPLVHGTTHPVNGFFLLKTIHKIWFNFEALQIAPKVCEKLHSSPKF
jgi:hypothetical protein